VPIVTCRGHAFAGRVGTSLLHAAGLPELVTSSLAEYEALAARLATGGRELSEARAKLARARSESPLFDTRGFTRHLEAAFAGMWERYRRGEPPAPFDVPA
jgi:predicted O-linked N-acetylglucosamine transferase (SPINDLY family)